MDDFLKEEKLSDLKKKYNIVRLNTFDIEKLKLKNHEEISIMTEQKTNFILYPWFPQQGITIIYAATGVGKTWFTLNCAYAIARGGNFLKYSVSNPKKVLYIDGEIALNSIVNRYKQIIKEQGDLIIKENFTLLNHEEQLPNFLPKLNDPSGQEAYLKLIEKYNYDVIVFDNFSCLSDIDENLSEQWAPIIRFLITLRAMGKSVICVHHCGKNKYEYRGSSKIMDIVDTSILLTSNNNDQLESEFSSGANFKVSYKKNRLMSGKDSLPFNVTYQDNKWTIHSNENSNIQYVVEAIKNKISHQSIANELGVSRQYISKLAKRAKEMNLIID